MGAKRKRRDSCDPREDVGKGVRSTKGGEVGMSKSICKKRKQEIRETREEIKKNITSEIKGNKNVKDKPQNTVRCENKKRCLKPRSEKKRGKKEVYMSLGENQDKKRAPGQEARGILGE